MSKSQFDSAVVVLGMHGSGGSLLAQLLRIGSAGASGLARSACAPGSGGRGALAIASLNRSILEEMGLDWRSLDPIESTSFSGEAGTARRERICRAVTEEFGADEVPLIDDPLTCRLLPLWDGALAVLAEDLHYPVVVPHPADLAHSLRQGDEAADDSLLLWARYYLDAEQGTRGKARSFVLHSDLVGDWRSVLAPLGERLGRPLDRAQIEDGAVDREISSLGGPGAVSHEVAARQLQSNPIAATGFEIFKRWARQGQEDEADYAALDEVRRQLDEMSRYLSSVPAFESVDISALHAFQKAQFARIHAELGSRARLDLALADALDEARHLRGRLARAEEEALSEARLQSQLSQARDDELKALETNLVAVGDELKSVKEKYRSTQAILARERQILKELRAGLARAEVELAGFRNSFAWQIYGRITRSLARLRRVVGLVTGARSPNRRERIVALIEESNLFDRDWYLETYPDVATGGVDPIIHYLDNGWREGRNPGPRFSTSAYLKANADVAAHGFNPLVHYVEYGHSEGRGAPELGEPSSRLRQMRRDFGPGAPCVSFPLLKAPAPRWRRAGEFEGTGGIVSLAGGLAIGRVADEAGGESLRAALEQLAYFSGAADAVPRGEVNAEAAGCAQLADIWYASSNRLHARWKRTTGEGAMVVRVLQHVRGEPEIIGEALLENELDVLDARLVNRFFPLLFLFSDADGLVLGSELLAFPSLCRGGVHYAELAAMMGAHDGVAIDACTASAALARDLLAIRKGCGDALVSTIAVDLSGAVGASSLFQGDFQQWLTSVALIKVNPFPAANGEGPQDYLEGAVKVDGGDLRGSAGGVLTLASDMVPSIAALCARSEGGGGDVALSFIMSAHEPSQQALLCHLPSGQAASAHGSFAPNFPSFSPPEGRRPSGEIVAYALRGGPAQGLSDAEFLVPISEPLLDLSETAAPMTWLFQPEDWDESQLFESLEALAAQISCQPASIVFVGAAPAAAADVAGRLFAKVTAIPAVDQLGPALDSPLVGYIGAGLIFHDRRSAAVLADLLDQGDHASASAALVAVAQRGKGVIVSPADLGSIVANGEPTSASLPAVSARLLWRSSWASIAPPRDLWLARAADVRRWIGDPAASCGDRVHACTAMVSATQRGVAGSSNPAIVPPTAAVEKCLRVEVVVG